MFLIVGENGGGSTAAASKMVKKPNWIVMEVKDLL